MADYYEKTIVQQIIPASDMTRLEFLLLSQIFSYIKQEDGYFFYAEEGIASAITVTRAELESAVTASSGMESCALAHVSGILKSVDGGTIYFDLAELGWECFFQDIVKRSSTLRFITVVSSLSCSKLRVDGFGGSVMLIAPKVILSKSTADILEEFFHEADLDE